MKITILIILFLFSMGAYSSPVFDSMAGAYAAFDFRHSCENFDCSDLDYKTQKVFGLYQHEALVLDGDPSGPACSKRHYYGDWSNRWCHASFVKAVKLYLNDFIQNEIVSSLLSWTVFLPKEYVLDKKPSMHDLVITEFPVYKMKNDRGNINLTIFGDLGAVLSFYGNF